ncbi:MAG: hypothetical protein FWG15_07620 [Propionibacteriaceae bacterium]|nr:hypothetical protein [Propionibacteriaceae bacterium]
MVEKMIFHVTATRSGRWWALQCQEHPGALSQVTRLDQAGETIREAIAFVANIPKDSFDIEVIPVLPEEFLREQKAMLVAREESKHLNSRSAEHAREAARILAETGLSLRDVGTVMGVSHQRAAQLVSS